MNKHIHITDDLLVKFMLGEAAPDERAQVQNWLNKNTGNKRYYNLFVTIWNESKTLAANTANIDENEAWQAFQSKIANNAVAAKQKNYMNKSFVKPMLTAAALVIMVLGSWLFFRSINKLNKSHMLSRQSGQYVLTDTLADGSIINLNKHTTVTYPAFFTGDTRLVTLAGEAFFTVTHNKEKPFIIRTNGVTITVVGTAFNVKNTNNTTQVIVENGLVRISSGNNTAELHKGEQAVITNSDHSIKKTITADSLYKYYRTKEIVCRNTALPDVIAVINEVYNTHIVLGDAGMSELRLTATFKENESAQTIITIIQQTFNLRVTQQGINIILND